MPSTYQLISSNVLTSSAASVTFSAIPSTYTDLVVRISARDTYPTPANSLELRINGDTSLIYPVTILSGDGSGASSQRFGATFDYTYMPNTTNAGGSTANTFSNLELYIPSYLASSHKPFGSFGVTENNATAARMQIQANQFRSNSAISSLSFISGNAYNFVSGSSFYLYGIKNS